MTYHVRRNKTDGRFEVEIEFHGTEAKLFRAGEITYLTMLAEVAEHHLEAAGAIGPFQYSCRPTGKTYILTVGEY